MLFVDDLLSVALEALAKELGCSSAVDTAFVSDAIFSHEQPLSVKEWPRWEQIDEGGKVRGWTQCLWVKRESTGTKQAKGNPAKQGQLNVGMVEEEERPGPLNEEL